MFRKGCAFITDLNKIGKFIVYLRKEKKLTQFQLAEQLSVSDKSVSKWERGICLPEPVTVEKLISFFNISLMEFYAGERNTRLTDKVANEATKYAVELSRKSENIKYKKIMLIIIVCFLIAVLIITCLFTYNTYNKYHVYSLSTSSEDFNGKGNIILAGDKSIITLMDLNLINDEIYNKEGYAFEYNLMLENLLLYKTGDIYSFEKTSDSNKVKIGDYIKSINICLKSDLVDIVKKDSLNKTNLTLSIKYINSNLEIDEYVMSFNIINSFSNNKLIVEKKIILKQKYMLFLF